MMLIPGRLSGTTLGDVLGLLHRERATGVLELVEREGPTAGRRHAIHLASGLVAGVDSSLKVRRIGEILRAEGFIGDEAAARLTRRLFFSPARLTGEILREEMGISQEVVGAALRRQLRLRIDALFSLVDAELRFRVARVGATLSTLPLSPREFLHGRARGRDRTGKRRAAAGSGRERARERAFELLGITPGSARADVQRAFRKLAAAVHPDRHPRASAPERAKLMQRFAELSAAYHLLVT